MAVTINIGHMSQSILINPSNLWPVIAFERPARSFIRQRGMRPEVASRWTKAAKRLQVSGTGRLMWKGSNVGERVAGNGAREGGVA